MSQSNVQVVQRAFDEFNQRDVDAMLADWADDVEMRPFGGFADLMGGGFKGREGVRHWFEECVGSLHVHAELESIFDAGHLFLDNAATTEIGESSGARVQLRG